MYDFKSNYEYTLTEVSTPTGYQGLEEPLKFKVSKDEDEEDQIEAWTGFDFFANLPEELQAACESSSDWAAFKSY